LELSGVHVGYEDAAVFGDPAVSLSEVGGLVAGAAKAKFLGIPLLKKL
jgi:hypothetical protein